MPWNSPTILTKRGGCGCADFFGGPKILRIQIAQKKAFDYLGSTLLPGLEICVFCLKVTPSPKLTRLPLKMNGWKMYFLLKSSFFGYMLVFRGVIGWIGINSEFTPVSLREDRLNSLWPQQIQGFAIWIVPFFVGWVSQNITLKGSLKWLLNQYSCFLLWCLYRGGTFITNAPLEIVVFFFRLEKHWQLRNCWPNGLGQSAKLLRNLPRLVMIEVGFFSHLTVEPIQVADFFRAVTPSLKRTNMKTASENPLKINAWKMKFPVGKAYFYGVSFREGSVFVNTFPSKKRTIHSEMRWKFAVARWVSWPSNQLPVTSDQEIVQNPKSLQRIFWLRKRTKKKANGTRSHITFFETWCCFSLLFVVCCFFLENCYIIHLGTMFYLAFFAMHQGQSKACMFLVFQSVLGYYSLLTWHLTRME